MPLSYKHMQSSQAQPYTTCSGTSSSPLQSCCALTTRCCLHHNRSATSEAAHSQILSFAGCASLQLLCNSWRSPTGLPPFEPTLWRLQRLVERWSIPRYLNFSAHLIPHWLTSSPKIPAERCPGFFALPCPFHFTIQNIVNFLFCSKPCSVCH
jgi:hypothetical protein